MAEKTEKVGNAKAAVQAAKIIQGAATAGLPGAAIATISDPKASFALVKKILIAVTVIIMLPTIIISSIPSSIINLISIDQTQDSSSSQVFKSKYDEFLTGFQEALSDDLSEDIECREFKANVCVLISYYSIWKDKKIIPISSSKLVSDFKKRIKKADLLQINKKKKTATYRGDDAFARYLKLSDDEIELGKAQGSVLASIIDLKNNGEITIDLSSVLDEDGGEYLGVSGAGKTYKLSKSNYELLCKIVAQECSENYDGSLAVISHMCNLAEYGSYRGKGLMGTAKSGWYSAYTSGAYKKRHPAAFVKRAVKDAINGKRNLPPYVLEFWTAGYKSKNWNYSSGERYYKRIGDNDYYYNIKDKKRLKKQTKAYEAALSGGGYSGAVVYYNQGDSPWGKHRFRGPYGTNKIKPAGCGPTSMAICISTITGKKVTPIQTCDWAAKQGHYHQGAGWDHSTPAAIAKHWNLKCQGLGYNKSNLKKALKQGKLIVAIMSPGHFTKGGHYIVLYGLSKDGKKLQVADCGGRARNGWWNVDTVFNEARSNAGANGPFWAISK